MIDVNEKSREKINREKKIFASVKATIKIKLT